MKRIIPLVLGLGILGAFAWTLLFLYNKSQAKPVVYETEAPAMADIVKKTVATGAIVPRKEVEIKPRVSGVIRKLAVQPGDYVKAGDLVAEIQIIPDMVTLNRAESAVQTARIAADNARRELTRHEGLFAQKVISAAELDRIRVEHDLEKQRLQEAVANLQLVREGSRRGAARVSNTQVRSTVEGMVLAVPVKEGESVIESNTFNAGTTLASVADMNDMIFQGKVDESEVGKITEGLDLDIRIGAVDKQTFRGTLEYISPKGVMEEGAIQFEIKAAILFDAPLAPTQPAASGTAPSGTAMADASAVRAAGVDKPATQTSDARTAAGPGPPAAADPRTFLRAGYSANADIVLDRRSQVLAIPEALLQFDDGKPFVDIEVASQQFEKRPVETGLSDGITIEIKSGLKLGDRIKKHR